MGWDAYLPSSTTEEVPQRRGRTQGPICFKLASRGEGRGEKGRRGEGRGERGEFDIALPYVTCETLWVLHQPHQFLLFVHEVRGKRRSLGRFWCLS